MKQTKIREIFCSLQGEGKYAGIKQVFVRFFECNLTCKWCDTPVDFVTGRSAQELTVEQVQVQVAELWDHCHSVSFTGGEPLLQKDFIQAIVPLWRAEGKKVYLETNGTLAAALTETINIIDFIAMDIKLPSSTRCRPFWQEHEEFLQVALKNNMVDLFIKSIISNETVKQDIEEMVKLLSRQKQALTLVLQPNSFELRTGVVDKCLEFQNYCLEHLSDVRVIPQWHKFLNLR